MYSASDPSKRRKRREPPRRSGVFVACGTRALPSPDSRAKRAEHSAQRHPYSSTTGKLTLLPSNSSCCVATTVRTASAQGSAVLAWASYLGKLAEPSCTSTREPASKT